MNTKAQHTLRSTQLVLLLSWSLTSTAQSDEMLTARTAKNTVFLDVDPKLNDLRLLGNKTDADDVLWEYATREPEPLILIKDNTYNLRLRLTNPLRYAVTVRGKEYTPDEYEKALQSVADNLQQVINIVSLGNDPYGSVAEADLRELVSGVGVESKPETVNLYKINIVQPGFQEEIEGSNEIHDYGLRRALMLYAVLNIDPEVWADKKEEQAQKLLRSIVRRSKEIEDQAGQNMISDAAKVLERLMKVDLSVEGAQQTMVDLQGLADTLKVRNSKMAASLKNLEDLRHANDNQEDDPWVIMDTWFNNMDPSKPRATGEAEAMDEREGQIQSALRIVELALQEFAGRMDKLLRQRQTLVQNLNGLIDVVSDARKVASKTEHGTDLIYDAAIPAGQQEKVAVTITERTLVIGADYSIKVKEKDLFTHQLKFMRAHTFYPQLFPAVVFVNAVYPEFVSQEDDNGIQRVQIKNNSQGYLNLAGMCNFNFKIDHKTEVPFLQLGGSAKKSQPQVFLGAGIRFAQWLGVSAGMAMTWQGSLTELEVGDQVTGQDKIDSDLKYRMSDPQFYFAIQLRPSTATKRAADVGSGQ